MPEQTQKQLETLDLSTMDVSTFQAKVAAARSAMDAAPKDPKLEAQVDAAVRAEIERIRDFSLANPNAAFAQANQHLSLGGTAAAVSATETWLCGGSVNMSSFVWWALGGTVMFKPPLAFMFGGKGGPDWAASTFTSGIAGSFVVDPEKIRTQEMRWDGSAYKGTCKFQLGQLGAGAGAVRISFYSLKGTYWGLLGGVSGGIGGASISGDCDLLWT
jgi:hypothetical protein